MVVKHLQCIGPSKCAKKYIINLMKTGIGQSKYRNLTLFHVVWSVPAKVFLTVTFSIWSILTDHDLFGSNVEQDWSYTVFAVVFFTLTKHSIWMWKTLTNRFNLLNVRVWVFLWSGHEPLFSPLATSKKSLLTSSTSRIFSYTQLFYCFLFSFAALLSWLDE